MTFTPSMARPTGQVAHLLKAREVCPRQLPKMKSALFPVQDSAPPRRAVSADRRGAGALRAPQQCPRASDPGFHACRNYHDEYYRNAWSGFQMDEIGDMFAVPDLQMSEPNESPDGNGYQDGESDESSYSSAISSSEISGTDLSKECHSKWILNLSMRYTDGSRREKFFITYRKSDLDVLRVTVSLDYSKERPHSLEHILVRSDSQQAKNLEIYRALRDVMDRIDFFGTVTNLRLVTGDDDRLQVHVAEDGMERFQYPSVEEIWSLKPRLVKESEVVFLKHMSGFVYEVSVRTKRLVKKEIPGPLAVSDFLYEIRALDALTDSPGVIKLYGVVVDENRECIKGLLIEHAEKGTLDEIIYDASRGTPDDVTYDPSSGIGWERRSKWARQIVGGLADVHDAGYVQGDFTLTNIVIDHDDDAKIIDINRRGCPVGWEPPEFKKLPPSSFDKYISVKSDLYQLGMVLWAIATQDVEPETKRPLRIGEDAGIPDWYRKIFEICLSEKPQQRRHASTLLEMFPEAETHNSIQPPASHNEDQPIMGTSLRPSDNTAVVGDPYHHDISNSNSGGRYGRPARKKPRRHEATGHVDDVIPPLGEESTGGSNGTPVPTPPLLTTFAADVETAGPSHEQSTQPTQAPHINPPAAGYIQGGGTIPDMLRGIGGVHGEECRPTREVEVDDQLILDSEPSNDL